MAAVPIFGPASVTNSAQSLRELLSASIPAVYQGNKATVSMLSLSIDSAAGAVIVYYGGSGVTTLGANAGGYLLAATIPGVIFDGTRFNIDLDSIYLVASAAGPTTVYVSGFTY